MSLHYIYFATSNPHKAHELRIALKDAGVEVKHIELELTEIQSDSIEEVARFKAADAYRIMGHPVIVEDTGLFIHALKGFPGVYSSYAFRTIGPAGILKLMEGVEDRRAVFRAVIALATSPSDIRIFLGECEGKIADEMRGSEGFGFDPIFIPEGHDRTFAEDYSYKNKTSHRKKAVDALLNFLQENRETLFD